MDARHLLTSVFTVLSAPPGEILAPLSRMLADVVPHRALAMLTGDCARHPMRTHGQAALTERITSTELARLGSRVDVGVPWFGTAPLAGEPRQALAIAATPPDTSGALLVIVTADALPPSEAARELARRWWDLVSLQVAERAANQTPSAFASNRFVASERTRAIAELTEAHSATLTSILGALRSPGLDDATARTTATGLAVAALIDLRAATDLDRSLTEESAGAAFDRLADKLLPLTRYSEVSLELAGPRERERAVPADVANAARAVVRSAVLTMLDQGGIGRIRAGWEAADSELRISVRDDGPGTLAADTFVLHRLAELVDALGGELTIDAVPQWGTTVTATLPLTPLEGPRPGPLDTLNPRELEVLQQLALGRRNRQIAEHLHISEHTVKFHVANILEKLEVGSRTEAAAVAHTMGLAPVA
ncbi:response regulator transcription factor [Nonomuraea africana]|uniref:DNA-binding CsgD family transcriptional regulator n=1 Tax=Nonomuraea africana TaxID=46171 RepID=A0ABR9KE03_9ACTN|nr:LuxR C-terminal-related transcriptional regulator [Nonomuraea africana]MBE1560219.1 DNA-binding CsgD family transcriptional regulator [Nonomuraea africana]